MDVTQKTQMCRKKVIIFFVLLVTYSERMRESEGSNMERRTITKR